MSETSTQHQKSVQLFIERLVAALYLRPWIDEPDERSRLRKEIVEQVKSDSSSLILLVELLEHPDWAVRHDVVEMLGWIGNADAVQPLLAVLWRDKSHAVRGNVALSLERIGNLEALEFSKDYRATIRSYPELVGCVADLTEREGISIQDIFNIERQNRCYGIRIKDEVETPQGALLSFDLSDILAIIGKQARASQWCCRNVECTGEYASEMHAVSDQGLIVSGRTFAYIALMLTQTIEGDFAALRNRTETWLVIRAVDSSWFEVWSYEPDVLDKVRGSFNCVTDI